MKKIKLTDKGIEVTPLAFGAWAIGGWFWGGANEKESVEALSCAIDNGMTTIDTAPVYGFGQSEAFVGKAIKGKRDKVQILTKFGLRWDTVTSNLHYKNTKDNDGNEVSIYRNGRKKSIITECENSLRRMGIDYIDLYQHHYPDVQTPLEETMEAIQILQSQGKIKAGGVSNYSSKQMQEAGKYFNLVSNQVPYSMLLRQIEKDLVGWCIENSKAIIAYSPLQRGILTGKITAGYRFSEGDHRRDTAFYKEPALSKINKFLTEIRPLADGKSARLAQIVIKWTLMQPGIKCVLAGARNKTQVLENIKATGIQLTTEDLNYIDSRLNQLLREL